MFSKFFIERPVLSNVIAIVIVLIGAVALYALPVSQYPDITPPVVQVQTRYPGASPQIIADTVATPIEEQMNGVEGMLYMQSTSAADGTYTLNVTFNVGTDLNFAQTLVQNRVAQALSQLPNAVQTQGVTTRKKSTSILQIITLSFPGRSLRQPVPCQLRHHQPARRAVKAAGGRGCDHLRGRPVQHAGVAGSQPARCAQPDPDGRG